MLYIMVANSPVPPDGIERLVIAVEGSKSQAIDYIKQEQLATRGVKYKVEGPVTDIPGNLVIAIQKATITIIDQQAVVAAQMQAAGTAQGRPEEPVQQGGFQKLSDQDMPIHDDLYGDPLAGEYSDVIPGQGILQQRPPQ
jgi:hypothetical protein